MSKNHLLLKEITLEDIGTIYSPITEQILKMDEEEYNKILTPFVLKIDDLKMEKEILEQNNIKLGREVTIFDYLFNDDSIRQEIINSLSFFYKTKEICLYDEGYLIYYDITDNQYHLRDNSVIISRDNWDKLCNLIKDLVCISNNKEQERKVTVEHEENNAVLEEYLRLMKQKEEDNKKLAENNATTLHDIVTIVASECNWDYDKTLEMTYYRLINSYRAIMSKDNYNANMMYHTSEKFDTSNMKIEHWTDSMKKG